MAANFQFDKSIAFSPEGDAVLRDIPASPGVFGLYGSRPEDEPYLTRAADLRRRIVRLLAPPESQSRRLNLRERVVRVAFSITGSEFESSLVLYRAAAAQFGHTDARRRLRLHTPFFLRMTMENTHPRVYSTNRLSRRALGEMYGPFRSRAAADRYCDEVLNLFKLRRCYEDLQPYPEHPGCAYGEMKKCLAPCNQTCTPEQYVAEAIAVKEFLDTQGESLLGSIAAEREQASGDMDFEKAAERHSHWQKVKSAAAFGDRIVQRIPNLNAVIVQPAAKGTKAGGAPEEAALFLLSSGYLAGPRRLSILGVRAVKEQTSVGSSLFAQPLMLQAIPLEGEGAELPAEGPEQRAERAIAALTEEVKPGSDVAAISDFLSLLRRWYYRPEKQRTGEIFFPSEDGSWPIKAILRGAARMVIGEPGAMAETQRDAAKAAKVRILHEGRPDVEREVPVIGRASRKRRSAETAAHDAG